MSDSGNSTDYGKKMKPANLYPEEGAERGANVVIRSAGFGELRGNFGHAGHNDRHAQDSKNDGEGAGTSQQTSQFSRQTKYATPDDGVDGRSSSTPPPIAPPASRSHP